MVPTDDAQEKDTISLPTGNLQYMTIEKIVEVPAPKPLTCEASTYIVHEGLDMEVQTDFPMMQGGTVCDASMVTELSRLFAAVTADMMDMRKYVERANNNNKDDMLEVVRRT